MTFSEKLRKARKTKDFSQEQLAELMGVSRQSISKWELGDGYPETEKLIQLAEILGVSLDYLLMNSQTTGMDSGVLPNNSDLPADENITIRSYDGSTLAAYNQFTIVKSGFSGKKRPKCLLGGKESSTGVWDGYTILGWYAAMEDAQNELDEIHGAIQRGETSYQLKYFARVTGRFNPKIVDGSITAQ